MRISYELQRCPVAGAGRKLRDFRLLGADGTCLLTARLENARVLPRIVEITDASGVCARIEREGMLGRTLSLTDLASKGTLRLKLPVVYNAMRTRAFDLFDPSGQVVRRLAPLSGLKDPDGAAANSFAALVDHDLALMADDTVLGMTSSPNAPMAKSSRSRSGSLSRVADNMRRLASEAVLAMRGDHEGSSCRFVTTGAIPEPDHPLIMMILLFRKFDYDFMRDVS